MFDWSRKDRRKKFINFDDTLTPARTKSQHEVPIVVPSDKVRRRTAID